MVVRASIRRRRSEQPQEEGLALYVRASRNFAVRQVSASLQAAPLTA
jgi:hypothetical protein